MNKFILSEDKKILVSRQESVSQWPQKKRFSDCSDQTKFRLCTLCLYSHFSTKEQIHICTHRISASTPNWYLPQCKNVWLKTRSNKFISTQNKVSPIPTWEDSAHGSEGVDLEGVHLPLGTEANHFDTHQEEAHSQKTDVHELTDDWKPEDTWEKWQPRESEDLTVIIFSKWYLQLITCLAVNVHWNTGYVFCFDLCRTNLVSLLASAQWSCDTFLPDLHLEEQTQQSTDNLTVNQVIWVM